jgi:hypothetical protein
MEARRRNAWDAEHVPSVFLSSEWEYMKKIITSHFRIFVMWLRNGGMSSMPMEHIMVNGRALCGAKGDLTAADGLGANLCAKCRVKYHALVWNQVRERIDGSAKDWAIYLLMHPAENRDQQLRILLKTTEVETRRILEAQSHGRQVSHHPALGMRSGEVREVDGGEVREDAGGVAEEY